MNIEVESANKVKHLEFIQQTINRMNNNSFLLKGWTIAIVSALFAFAAKDANPKFFWISFISVPLFWGLDSYFLFQERLYRSFYNIVRLKSPSDIDFDMDASFFTDDRNSWWQSLWSKTLFWFYFSLMIVITIVTLILK